MVAPPVNEQGTQQECAALHDKLNVLLGDIQTISDKQGNLSHKRQALQVNHFKMKAVIERLSENTPASPKKAWTPEAEREEEGQGSSDEEDLQGEGGGTDTDGSNSSSKLQATWASRDKFDLLSVLGAMDKVLAEEEHTLAEENGAAEGAKDAEDGEDEEERGATGENGEGPGAQLSSETEDFLSYIDTKYMGRGGIAHQFLESEEDEGEEEEGDEEEDEEEDDTLVEEYDFVPGSLVFYTGKPIIVDWVDWPNVYYHYAEIPAVDPGVSMRQGQLDLILGVNLVRRRVDIRPEIRYGRGNLHVRHRNVLARSSWGLFRANPPAAEVRCGVECDDMVVENLHLGDDEQAVSGCAPRPPQLQPQPQPQPQPADSAGADGAQQLQQPQQQQQQPETNPNPETVDEARSDLRKTLGYLQGKYGHEITTFTAGEYDVKADYTGEDCTSDATLHIAAR